MSGARLRKADALALAERHGLVSMANVTKKTDLLVVSDPDSRSSKAERARRYGIPVVPEDLFWRTLGVTVD